MKTQFTFRSKLSGNRFRVIARSETDAQRAYEMLIVRGGPALTYWENDTIIAHITRL